MAEDVNAEIQANTEVWKCQQCSLLNTASVICCEVCGNKINMDLRQNSSPKLKEREFNQKENQETCSNGELNHAPKKSNSFLTLFQDAKAKASKFLGETTNKENKVINNENKITIEKKQPDHIVTNSFSEINVPSNNTEANSKDLEMVKKNKFFVDDQVTENIVFIRQSSTKCVSLREDQVFEALERWNITTIFCKEAQMLFVDDSFPPLNKSLTFNGTPISKVNSWLRPHEISKLNKSKIKWEVFRNPRPCDIIQGTLGNCWFLSALAVVCEITELLENIMITNKICEEGIYQVRICKNGKWVIVDVDDYLPCDSKGQLVYSQAARHQLWVPIIEKAVAKSVGCYEALVAGRCIEGLQLLTGCSCDSILLHSKPDEDVIDKDLIWGKLLSCRNAGYLMGASCGGDISDEVLIEGYRQVGLEAQHAYSVLDIQQVNGHRLVRLRNPWGRCSWTGDWSDLSPLWTKELRNQLKAHGSDEGVFWISLEDMITYFDCVDICKYQADWTEVAVEGEFSSPINKTGQACYLTVFSPTELDITLFQESNRGSQTESLASLDLLIGVYRATSGTPEPQPLTYVAHSDRKIKPSVLCNVFLDVGVYLIIPAALNHWNNGLAIHSSPKYVLSIHSSKRILTDHIPLTRYSFSDALFLLVEKMGKKHEGIPGVTCYYMSYKLAGLIVAAENRRSDVHLHVDCDCGNSFNVVSTRGALHTNDCLPPLSRQILTVLTQLEGTDGYSVSHKLRFRISPLNAYNGIGSHQHPLLVQGLSEIHNPRPL